MKGLSGRVFLTFAGIGFCVRVPTGDSGAEQQITFLDTLGHDMLLFRQMLLRRFWILGLQEGGWAGCSSCWVSSFSALGQTISAASGSGRAWPVKGWTARAQARFWMGRGCCFCLGRSRCSLCCCGFVAAWWGLCGTAWSASMTEPGGRP